MNDYLLLVCWLYFGSFCYQVEFPALLVTQSLNNISTIDKHIACLMTHQRRISYVTTLSLKINNSNLYNIVRFQDLFRE